MKRLLKRVNTLILLTCSMFVSFGSLCSDKMELQGEIVQFGIYKGISVDLYIDQPETAAGFTSIGESELIYKSDVVKPKLGQGIGFEYKFYLKEISEINRVEVVINHPIITNKEGKTYYVSRHFRSLPDKPGVYGSKLIYFFSQEFEMVPGDWNLQILYENMIVLEKGFKVSF